VPAVAELTRALDDSRRAHCAARTLRDLLDVNSTAGVLGSAEARAHAALGDAGGARRPALPSAAGDG
jgi:predicted trehalose synthase